MEPIQIIGIVILVFYFFNQKSEGDKKGNGFNLFKLFKPVVDFFHEEPEEENMKAVMRLVKVAMETNDDTLMNAALTAGKCLKAAPTPAT